jgi:o-succinylbenzoate---CoA ligase
MNSTTLLIGHHKFAGSRLKELSYSKINNPATPAWEKEVFRFILDWMGPADSIVQHSSGTTGRSKRLHLLKESMRHSAENTLSFFDLRPGQTVVHCLPMQYIAGKMMVVRCLTGGLNLEIVEPRSLPDLSGCGGIDFCAMVPLQVMNLLKKTGGLSCIRKLLIGGTEITRELESLVSDVTAEVYAGFGMAETCSHIALRRINGPGAQNDYRALPGIELTLDNRGCLVIAAPYLPNPIITNDLVEFSGPGAFFWIGRYDNLINAAGIKIVPEEMEARIADRTGLICTVIGLRDERLGQKPVLVFEKTPEISESFVRSAIQDLFPVKKQPAEIVWVDAFPRNASAKVDRRKLTGMIRRMF